MESEIIEVVKLDAAQKARAKEIGDAIQELVAKRPDVAVSPLGMGLDMLSTLLIRDPDGALDIAPWINLAADAFGFIVDGDPPDVLDTLRAALTP